MKADFLFLRLLARGLISRLCRDEGSPEGTPSEESFPRYKTKSAIVRVFRHLELRDSFVKGAVLPESQTFFHGCSPQNKKTKFKEFGIFIRFSQQLHGKE